MAYTLAQFAKLETDPNKKYVLRNLLREIKAGEYLQFEDVSSLTVSGLKWRQLPSVAFRALGDDYTEDTSGDVDSVWEGVYPFGGLVKFDRIYDKVSNTVVDPKRLQLDMKTLSMALTFNDYLINGDHGTDVKAFEGLKKRVSLMPTRQKVIPTAASATALDVTASAANVNAFWGKGMDKAFEYCNRGNVDLIITSEDMKLGLGRSLRYGNAAGGHFLDFGKDSFDRAVVQYKGAPVIDIGIKADQSTEIITDTETAEDAGADGTSMYFVSINKEQGVVGIQLGPLEVVPEAKKDVGTANQTLIEWVCGLCGFGSYGVVRLQNILAPDTWTY